MQHLSRVTRWKIPATIPVQTRSLRCRWAFAVLALTTIALPLPVEAQEVMWVRQFGTGSAEQATGAATTASVICVAGHIQSGSLGGQSSVGSADAFVRVYDRDGSEVWTRQFGTSALDRAHGVAANGNGVYVVGSTMGVFAGESRAGSYDAYVTHFDMDGHHVWTRQFGSPNDDEASAVAVLDDGVYVSGWTVGVLPGETGAGYFDAFVVKFDTAGNHVWTRQFGTGWLDKAYSVAADAGGIYVAGETGRPLGGEPHFGSLDGFIRKYDVDGGVTWTRQIGTVGDDVVHSVCADGAFVYVGGRTSGTFPGQVAAGGSDAFVYAYDSNGNAAWVRQFGGAGDDEAWGVAADANGVFVTGRTSSALPGETHEGGDDVYVRKFDSTGADVWMDQIGTSADEASQGVAIDASGAYIVGSTMGAFSDQTSQGGRDAFVVHHGIAQPPPDGLTLELDIKPGGCPNTLNVEWMRNRYNGQKPHPHMGGVIPLAIVGDGQFDVYDIDPASLRLEGVAPSHWSYEDVTAPKAASDDCACQTRGPDGTMDLAVKFSKQQVVEAMGLVGTEVLSSLTVVGTTMDGTTVEASDCVTLVNADAMALDAAVPNPFNPSTTIRFTIPQDARVSLDVYDVNGRHVAQLVDGFRTAGEYSVLWEAKGMASGVYFYRLQSRGAVETRRMILVK